MKRLFPLLLTLTLLCACGAPPVAENKLPPATEAPPPTAKPAAPEGAEVTLDGLSSYLRVTLPEGWTWEEREATADGRVLVLRPETDADFPVELHWWASTFAMCGTGVSFSDYLLPDGRSATLAVEDGSDCRFWTLILPEAPDSFTVQIVAEPAAFDAHAAELESLLLSLRTGVLAQLTPVSTETPAENA